MKIPALATVYLDNTSVGLMGDPQPRVSKIVAAGGKDPGSVQVLRTQSPTELKGKPVRMDDVIDRTAEPARPIYLRSKPRGSADAPAMKAPARAYLEPPADESGPKPLGHPLPGDPGDDEGFAPSGPRRSPRVDRGLRP